MPGLLLLNGCNSVSVEQYEKLFYEHQETVKALETAQAELARVKEKYQAELDQTKQDLSDMTKARNEAENKVASAERRLAIAEDELATLKVTGEAVNQEKKTPAVQEQTPEPEPDETQIIETPQKEKPVSAEAAERIASVVTFDDYLTVAEATIASSYGGNYEISHSGNNVIINVWGDGVALGATYAAAGDADAKKVWSSVVENTRAMCAKHKEILDDYGFLEKHVNVNILNDLDHSKVLASFLDGVTIMDVADN